MAVNREADALWTIVGYMLSGLLFWGGAGYLADKYFNTSYLTLVGFLLGMGGALYLILLRFGRE
jgi:ATP synthase protein I